MIPRCIADMKASQRGILKKYDIDYTNLTV